MNSFQDWARKCGVEVIKDPVRCVQVNVGYQCNLHCAHCHVEAGPQRHERMDWQVMVDILRFIDDAKVTEVDITGGAPECNPDLIRFITELRQRNFINRILLRTNLAIYTEKSYHSLPEILYGLNVELVASMPCYLEENVERQRGKGVFAKNIEVLRRLNKIGFGTGLPGRKLHLVYNPGGDFLPGAQEQLEKAYKEHMSAAYGISFDRLYTITNMPLGRFARHLRDQGRLDDYVQLLKISSRGDNLAGLMCRYTLSVDWRGCIYDCDFNQALGKPVRAPEIYIGRINARDLTGLTVVTGEHCFGCTAGAGSSCRGSLADQPA